MKNLICKLVDHDWFEDGAIWPSGEIERYAKCETCGSTEDDCMPFVATGFPKAVHVTYRYIRDFNWKFWRKEEECPF